jgi:pyocin large subunit-like protein
MHWRRLVLALLTALVSLPMTVVTAKAAAVSTYDAPAIACVGLHEFGTPAASPEKLSDTREVSASPPAEAGDGSMTPRPACVATNTVRTSDLVDGPLWTSTKKGSSAQNALRHFNDHGADFPDVQNAMEYVAKAQDFLRTPSGGTLTRIRSNGDVVRYHPGSNTFGVMVSVTAEN